MNAKKNVGLKACIINIIPVSVYLGKTYTQDVIIKLDTSQKLVLDDAKKLCKEEYLGKTTQLIILIYVFNSIKKIETEALKIIPTLINHNYQGPYADIYGYIEDIILTANEKKEEDFPHAVLNVGTGKLILFLDNEYIKLVNKGDYIKIKGARLDLKAIELV